MVNRRFFIKGIAASASLPILASGQAKARRKASASAKSVAGSMLRLANTTQNAQLSKADRDKYAEALEAMSAAIVKEYNTGALCDTDLDCENKFGSLK